LVGLVGDQTLTKRLRGTETVIHYVLQKKNTDTPSGNETIAFGCTAEQFACPENSKIMQ